MHVFCIFLFAPVQHNWTRFTWKGALAIRSLLLLLLTIYMKHTLDSLVLACFASQLHAKWISRTHLLRQLYTLPHWDRSCRSNLQPHSVTLYWNQANQSQQTICQAPGRIATWSNKISVSYMTGPGKARCKPQIIIIIITIIKYSKAQIEIFNHVLTAPQTVSNMYAQVARAQSCANHVQHIEHLSCATCLVTCHMVQRDSSPIKFNRV